MQFEIYPFNTFETYFSADVIALHKGKWLLCMHKERSTWEHPSGWIEEGETPLEAAKRELLEETGFGGGRWVKYYQSAPNPSNMTSICYTYLATNVDTIKKTKLDESEDIEICLLSKNEIIKNCFVFNGNL